MLFPLTYIVNYTHEKSHQAVFDRRGIKSKIKVSIFDESYCEAEKDTKETNVSNDIVDAVGYQLMPVIYLLWFMGLFLVV